MYCAREFVQLYRVARASLFTILKTRLRASSKMYFRRSRPIKDRSVDSKIDLFKSSRATREHHETRMLLADRRWQLNVRVNVNFTARLWSKKRSLRPRRPLQLTAPYLLRWTSFFPDPCGFGTERILLTRICRAALIANLAIKVQ